jgi:uncharacterized membrane protein
MSLEAKIEALTAAVEANTKALAGGAKAPAKETAKAPTAAEKKKAAAEKKKAAEPEVPSIEDVAATVTAYLKAGDPDDRAKARENVAAISKHFEADRFTAIASGKLIEALDMLNDFSEGRWPEALPQESEEEEEDLV